MKWIVKYKDKLFDKIKYREYTYVDNRGRVTNPYMLWRRDYCQDNDSLFYDYLGVEYVED